MSINHPPLGRLKKRSEFLAVTAKGQKWVAKTVILQIMPQSQKISRFGLTVTKKISAKAVDRNRIRRRLRALAIEILSTLAQPGCDYVLIGRAETQTAKSEDIKKDILWCLKRLNALATQ